MTEKQFIYNRCEDGFFDIIDVKNHHTYPVGNMEIFVIGIVKLLNNLVKPKQCKKQVLQLIDEKIKECDTRTCDCCRNCIADQLLGELREEIDIE